MCSWLIGTSSGGVCSGEHIWTWQCEIIPWWRPSQCGGENCAQCMAKWSEGFVPPHVKLMPSFTTWTQGFWVQHESDVMKRSVEKHCISYSLVSKVRRWSLKLYAAQLYVPTVESPHVTLKVKIPDTYPSLAPPTAHVSAPFLSDDTVRWADQELERQYRPGEQNSIRFSMHCLS